MKINNISKINKDEIINLERKNNRLIELQVGRVNYNRVHVSKKAYTRKGKSAFKLKKYM